MNKKVFRIQLAIEHMRSHGADLHFLTLTTPDECTVRQVAYRWRSLCNSRYWRNLHLSYVQVFERHPGGHGWHVHAVVSRMIDVDTFRPELAKCGFGRFRIDRCKGPSTALVMYLAKYVSKSLRYDGPADAKGVRMVNVSRGLPVLRQIVVYSPDISFVRGAMKMVGNRISPYKAMRGLFHLYYTFPFHNPYYLSSIHLGMFDMDFLIGVYLRAVKKFQKHAPTPIDTSFLL